MSVFVLDTNIISYYLKGHDIVVNNITKAIINGDNIVIAPIAYYEIKRGLIVVNSQKRLNAFNNFCTLFEVGQLNNSILNIAAEIYAEQRKMGHTMEDADIFIAAFCKNQKATLITNNTKHFEHISGLVSLDWSVTI
ncbi:MAG: type II toxin-antitoxin system VapC family toxin [Dysgonamonadaceae bacterium]|jgi:predicted nucleic acid-binding protein|nr:type II toxin-antitoxin system VapC family toxin [Dysgonamonadaceae bacterium]